MEGEKAYMIEKSKTGYTANSLYWRLPNLADLTLPYHLVVTYGIFHSCIPFPVHPFFWESGVLSRVDGMHLGGIYMLKGILKWKPVKVTSNLKMQVIKK